MSEPTWETVREVEAELESLRELKDTREMERNMAEGAAASFKERAEAAEAKLAEVEKERDEFKADTQRRWHALEAELAEKRASMGRVRELAKELSDGVADIEGDWAKRMQATADRVARLLSGNEKCPRCGKSPDEKCAEDGPGMKVNTSMCPRKRLLSGDEDYIERHKLYAPPVTDDSLSGGE